jgi:hypothetical protein
MQQMSLIPDQGQLQLPQPHPRKAVQERGQEGTVRAGQPRPVDLPLQDGEWVAQRQDLDVLVGTAHPATI